MLFLSLVNTKKLYITISLFIATTCLFLLLDHASAATAPGGIVETEEYSSGIELYGANKNEEALRMFMKGVDKNDPLSQTWAGMFYIQGIGVTQNIDKGMSLLQKGADGGSTRGMAELAMILIYGGYDIKPAPQKGIEYLDKAVSLESPTAFFYRGIVYEDGAAGEKSIEKAISMYEKAESAGNLQAKARKLLLQNKAQESTALIRDVRANQLRFDKEYKEKQLVAVGFVGEIKQDPKQGYRLVLYGERSPAGPFDYIECYFSASQEDTLLELNRDDLVIIQGTYRGKQEFQVGAICLYECSTLM